MTFAAFILCRSACGRGYCATTRDKGSIGLPGGKLDQGETAAEAAFREAQEEGWKLNCSISDLVVIHEDMVDGQKVVWFKAPNLASKMVNFKEKGRIKPIVCDLETIANSGFGNDFLYQDPFDVYCQELK